MHERLRRPEWMTCVLRTDDEPRLLNSSIMLIYGPITTQKTTNNRTDMRTKMREPIKNSPVAPAPNFSAPGQAGISLAAFIPPHPVT